MTGTFTKRCDKLAFYGVESEGSVVFKKMQGFTSIVTSKNPKTYTRRYVDEEFEQSDIVGYSTKVDYSFDRYAGNSVHDDIVAITDGEKTGDDAVRQIVIADLASESDGSYKAIMREFSVIPESEGSSNDAYTYSGSFKVKGDIVYGTASIEGDVCTFTPDGV